jgi:hypothetical protein
MRKKSKNSRSFPCPSDSALFPVSRTLPADNPARRSWNAQRLNRPNHPETEELWASPQRRRYLLSIQPEARPLA